MFRECFSHPLVSKVGLPDGEVPESLTPSHHPMKLTVLLGQVSLIKEEN